MFHIWQVTSLRKGNFQTQLKNPVRMIYNIPYMVGHMTTWGNFQIQLKNPIRMIYNITTLKRPSSVLGQSSVRAESARTRGGECKVLQRWILYGSMDICGDELFRPGIPDFLEKAWLDCDFKGFTLPYEYHWTPCTLSTLQWEFSGTAQGLSVHFQEMRLVPESPCTLYMDFTWTVQGLYQPNH